MFSSTTEKLYGSDTEIKKAEAMNSLHEKIMKFIEIAPYIDSFENIKYISLVLTNVGTDYDEDVRVTLFFNQSDFLSAEDIVDFDEEALNYILNEQEFEDSIQIKKGVDFLAYHESVTNESKTITPYQILPLQKISKEQQCDTIRNLLGYYYILDKDKYVVELVFDKINHHTSVAFPTVILLKNNISKIKYIIKSKRSPEIYENYIAIE